MSITINKANELIGKLQRDPTTQEANDLKARFPDAASARAEVSRLIDEVASLIERAKAAYGDNRAISLQFAANYVFTAKSLMNVHGSASYTVQPGDTLSGIAKKLLGNANRYPELAEANRDVWAKNGKRFNPDMIHPGWVFNAPGKADFSNERVRLSSQEREILGEIQRDVGSLRACFHEYSHYLDRLDIC